MFSQTCGVMVERGEKNFVGPFDQAQQEHVCILKNVHVFVLRSLCGILGIGSGFVEAITLGTCVHSKNVHIFLHEHAHSHPIATFLSINFVNMLLYPFRCLGPIPYRFFCRIIKFCDIYRLLLQKGVGRYSKNKILCV
jgi:hypothetical protein